jgi:tetratricopeptide (TPR) repeat protein
MNKRNILLSILCLAILCLIVYSLLTDNDAVPDVVMEDKDTLLRTAWKSFSMMDTDGAANLFVDLATDEETKTADKQQALYGLIVCYEHGIPDPDFVKAMQYAEEFMEEYSDSDLAPWVMLEKGHIYQETGRPEKAREVYKKILDKYDNSHAIHETALALANSYFYEMDEDVAGNGIDVLKQHLKEYPDNKLKRIMLFRLSYRLAETELKYEKALTYAERLGELKMCDPFRWGMQFWLLGQIYNLELGNVDKAVYWYQKIIDECEYDQRVFSAKQMINRLKKQEK